MLRQGISWAKGYKDSCEIAKQPTCTGRQLQPITLSAYCLSEREGNISCACRRGILARFLGEVLNGALLKQPIKPFIDVRASLSNLAGKGYTTSLRSIFLGDGADDIWENPIAGGIG